MSTLLHFFSTVALYGIKAILVGVAGIIVFGLILALLVIRGAKDTKLGK